MYTEQTKNVLVPRDADLLEKLHEWAIYERNSTIMITDAIAEKLQKSAEFSLKMAGDGIYQLGWNRMEYRNCFFENLITIHKTNDGIEVLSIAASNYLFKKRFGNGRKVILDFAA